MEKMYKMNLKFKTSISGDIIDRINELQKESGLDKKRFAEKINVSPAALTHLNSGRNKPSLELMLNILKFFSNLSSEWLLFGYGPKYRDENIRFKNEYGYKPVANIKQENQNLKKEVNNRLQILKLLIDEHNKYSIGAVV
jgi:DNA-binding XRE family transcriptional regulator